MASLRSWARGVVRRGDRLVVAIPDWAGFGNQLYYYFLVERLREAGVDALAIPPARGRPWLTHFPAIEADLTSPGTRPHWSDRRDDTDWADLGTFGVHYTRSDLHRFVDRYLLPDLATPDPPADDELIVNVRRGDYYSDPRVRGIFGFDQLAYLGEALAAYAERQVTPRSIRVVSDDPGWCAARLGFLAPEGADVRYDPPTTSPFENFRAVANGRHLIITNSTFSVWAAHVSHRRYAADGIVVAPAFGTRPHRGPWVALDPRWHIVRDIPGGWDS